MPVTLTENPNPLLLQTASFPPSGSWITSLFFLPFLLLLVPLSLPLPSALHPSFFLSLLLLPHHFTDPPALHSRPLSYLFQSFILVFPVLREYSLLISSEHSHRLLSWCNSAADIPSCTYESQSAPHSYIVYSEILSC